MFKGLPKPCNISVGRIVSANVASAGFLGPDDIFYTALPLYHSAGFLVGLIETLRVGR